MDVDEISGRMINARNEDKKTGGYGEYLEGRKRLKNILNDEERLGEERKEICRISRVKKMQTKGLKRSLILERKRSHKLKKETRKKEELKKRGKGKKSK